MAKTRLITSTVLPDIDQQIAWVKRIRKDIIPCIKALNTEIDMVFAIEQSLLAARLLTEKVKRLDEPGAFLSESDIDENCRAILISFRVPVTPARIAALKAVLSKEDKPFTSIEIYKIVHETREVTLRAITLILTLFKTRGLLEESKMEPGNITAQRRGRPEIKFVYKSKNKVAP